MKVRLKEYLLVVTAESEDEKALLNAWAALRDGHVFALFHQDGQTFRLNDLGPRPEACREPISITSRSADPAIQLISNFAHTPFELDGVRYGSVEAFWQGLKFSDMARREAIACLHGQEACRAGFDAPDTDLVEYRGRSIRCGTADHWGLMATACWAKFNQHEEAKRALLATGERPLHHKTRRDSRNIPGVVMADIWMKVRRALIKRADVFEGADSGDGEEHDNNDDRQSYTVHSQQEIRGFSGDFRFLSNFYPAPAMFEGVTYGSSENAYQAAKSLEPKMRELFRHVPPGKAKVMGGPGGVIARVRPDWEMVLDTDDGPKILKVLVMEQIVEDKFRRNPDLMARLLDTGERYLEELNHWGDRFWGVCCDTNNGENHLGRILMKLRSKLAAEMAAMAAQG